MADQKSKGQMEELDLDMSLDDIADLPGFLTPPTGAYKVLQLSSERKELGEQPAMCIKWKILEVLELNPDNLDDKEEPPKAGDEFEIPFMLANAFGVGGLKMYLKPIAGISGKTSVKENLEAGNNMELLLVLHRKFDKKKDAHYTKIKEVGTI